MVSVPRAESVQTGLMICFFIPWVDASIQGPSNRHWGIAPLWNPLRPSYCHQEKIPRGQIQVRYRHQDRSGTVVPAAAQEVLCTEIHCLIPLHIWELFNGICSFAQYSLQMSVI
jgi:hypothetical protein